MYDDDAVICRASIRAAEFLTPLLGLKLVGIGRHRRTYKAAEGWVLKFPRCNAGMMDNYRESETWKRYGRSDGYANYAECEIVDLYFLTEFPVFPVLWMEWVEETRSFHNLPHWTYMIDCAQVGYNKDGILVAYDYAG